MRMNWRELDRFIGGVSLTLIMANSAIGEGLSLTPIVASQF